MPSFKPVTRESHGKKFWTPQSKFHFAAKEAVIPLTVDELPRAVLALPIGFIRDGENFVPCAVVGIKSGESLMVPPDGRWLGRYIPAILRVHPFAIAPVGTDREVLCVDEDSGLLSDGPDGERFFDDDGKLPKSIQDALTFLQNISANRKQTLRICALLKAHALIQPWTITIKAPEGEHRVEGLFRIDEAALNALPGEAFLELRAGGALPVAYFQLLSMQLLPALGSIANEKAEAEARKLPVNTAGELDLEFMNDGPLLDFSRLK